MTDEIRIQPPDPDEVKREYGPLIMRVHELDVVDSESHGLALGEMKALAGAERKVRERLDPIIGAANAAHKGMTKLRGDLLRPIEQARAVLDARCLDYERVERAKAEAESRRLQEDARKREEERQILDAIAAEESGDKATAAAIMEETPSVPVVHVAPAIAKVDGVSSRTTWRAEVHDLKALVGYVGTHPEWMNLLLANDVALNALARSQREALAIPGVRAVAEQVRSVRA